MGKAVEPQVAFVDDTGGTNLDSDLADVGSHFIVTAAIVAEALLESSRARAEDARRTHFQSGEMKSSSVGKKLARRFRVLRDLSAGPWRFYSLAIDKSQVNRSSGLIYKRPFLKFLHRQLYQRLFDAFPNLEIVADEHGTTEFMQGFRTYVERHFRRDLFSEMSFEFRESGAEPLLQVADFIGGSLSYVFDPRKQTEHSHQILSILQPVSLGIEEWPPRRRLFAATSPENSPHDPLVHEVALKVAADFVEGGVFEDEEEDQRCQRELLKYLLFHFLFHDQKQFVTASKLIAVIQDQTGISLGADRFRLKIIGPLRDAGILIASGPAGYKLPRSLADMQSFVEHGHSIIAPMLDRLDRARRRLMLASNGEVDILEKEEHGYLKKCIESRLGA